MAGVARPDHEATPVFSVRLPQSLHDELRLHLLDPRTGSVRRGVWNKTIERILREWLDRQKVAAP